MSNAEGVSEYHWVNGARFAAFFIAALVFIVDPLYGALTLAALLILISTVKRYYE